MMLVFVFREKRALVDPNLTVAVLEELIDDLGVCFQREESVGRP